MFDLKNRLKRLATAHRQGPLPNFFIFSSPRSGSTWLAEMIATQGRFKIVNEPFNLRKPYVRENLGLIDWESLFYPDNRPIIRSYVQSFIEGNDRDLRFRRERPFTEFWHPRTDRIVFKILFAGEDDVNWFHTEFNAHIILLLRHPIPVSLSRKSFPRLQAFLTTPFANNFSVEQLSYAKRIIASGDPLQIGVLDWCLKNAVPIRHAAGHWTVICYEQIVLQPEVIVRYLARKYALPKPEVMERRIYTASRSTELSNNASQAVLHDDDAIRKQRIWLTEKWKDRVSTSQEDLAFETLHAFGIRIYARGQTLPTSDFLLADSYLAQ